MSTTTTQSAHNWFNSSVLKSERGTPQKMRVRTFLADLLVLLALLATAANAFPQYQNYIPNGNNVPNPCQPNTVWSGVGHQAPGGAGVRNPFGVAFDASHENWTVVCPLDSDGDGKTNGQELGDPNCTWKTGMPSPPATNLSHPGVCEPLDSMTCMSKNSWLVCPSRFNCPATSQPGVISTALRLPPTSVPNDTTTYVRYGFFLPNDTNYHIIAYKPIINTSQVLHHMLIYACNDGFKDFDAYSTPRPSGIMPATNCTALIGIWAVGDSGQCLSKEFGFLIGKDGFKYVLLEFHWNNPTQSTSYVDSSGMTIYYTPGLRSNTGGIMMTGQEFLNIPPRLSSYSVVGGCSSYCTSALPDTLYIASVFLHMHLLGSGGFVKLYRNGVYNMTLLDAPTYDYNTPVIVSLDTPVAFLPGDSLVVNCTFQSLNQISNVTWGETTSNEMCYAFVTYYKVNPQFETCLQWRSIDRCSNVRDKCSTNSFNFLAVGIPSVCFVPPTTNCSITCKMYLETIVSTGCLSDDYVDVFSMYDPISVKGILDVLAWCGVSRSMTTVSLTSSTTPMTTAFPTTPPRNSASKTSMNMVLNGLLSPITVFLILVLKSLVQELTP